MLYRLENEIFSLLTSFAFNLSIWIKFSPFFFQTKVIWNDIMKVKTFTAKNSYYNKVNGSFQSCLGSSRGRVGRWVFAHPALREATIHRLIQT